MTRGRSFSPVGAVLGLLALVWMAGCAHGPLYDSMRDGPFFTPTNVAAEPHLAGVRRVVVLPVAMGRLSGEETAAMLDRLALEALQREHRFEVVAFSRAECQRKFRVSEFPSAAALPHNLLDILRQEHLADGVLFVDLTTYSAYRPLTIGLRGKLALIDGSRILWNFDNVFAADEPAVANSARRHFAESERERVPGADFSIGVLQSPVRFAGYALSAMFATLPPARVAGTVEIPTSAR